MSIQCNHVQRVLDLAVEDGNSVVQVSEGWEKVRQVVHMQSRLSEKVRREVEAVQPQLRAWSTKRTPHNAAEEGFTCDECKVAISFPN